MKELCKVKNDNGVLSVRVPLEFRIRTKLKKGDYLIGHVTATGNLVFRAVNWSNKNESKTRKR